MAKKSGSNISRRNFTQTIGAGALAAGLGSLFPRTVAATIEKNLRGLDLTATARKIALEEHFSVPGIPTNNSDADAIRLQIEDIGKGRIAEMDRGGVERCILSLVAPGIQGISDVSQAIATSRRANDYLAEHVAKHPERLKGFAALPMQDPQAASQELARCVKELGFCGALVNNFTESGGPDSAVYYDLPQYRPFWATLEQLDVPFYLHPRLPLPARQQSYEGHPWLLGSAWGFAAEASIHALRLMGSGLFDEHPKLKIILGHLGEGVPFNIWRVDHRISRTGSRPKAKLTIGHYLRENFHITTSGNFRTQSLTDVIAEVGVEHVLYSVDYPFEDMTEAANWFDRVAIEQADWVKIARGNAQKLFRL